MGHFHHRLNLPADQSPSLDLAIREAAAEPDVSWAWESVRASATLVLTETGAPIRTIVTGRRPITTGSYASRKAGRPFPFESMNERAFFMHCEVDTRVLDYRAQPFRFEFVVDGRKHAYIADAVRLLDTGEVEVIEIKHDRRALSDPEYALKLECVKQICEQIGWRFLIVFAGSLLLPRQFFANVQDVQSWRLTTYHLADVYDVLEALEVRPDLTLGKLADSLGSRVAGAAKLKAMMVGRIVCLDLSRPLGMDTAVEKVGVTHSPISAEAVQ